MIHFKYTLANRTTIKYEYRDNRLQLCEYINKYPYIWGGDWIRQKDLGDMIQDDPNLFCFWRSIMDMNYDCFGVERIYVDEIVEKVDIPKNIITKFYKKNLNGRHFYTLILNLIYQYLFISIQSIISHIWRHILMKCYVIEYIHENQCYKIENG